MRSLGVLAMMAGLVATGAHAQGVDLTGQYQCVQLCAPGGQVAYITQNGSNLNLVNEAGEPSRAWIDWYGHMWVEAWNEGAAYSPDGIIIQFDRGAVWQRYLGEPAPAAPLAPDYARPPRYRRGAAAPSETVPVAVNAYDGIWSVVILTQSGGCEPEYRYGVRISNGNISNDSGGGPVSLQGNVSPNGAVQVIVSSGGQQAQGEGRLSRVAGSGTWHGEGSGGSCAGVWQAARR